MCRTYEEIAVFPKVVSMYVPM